MKSAGQEYHSHFIDLETESRNFPGDPMAKTLRSQFRGHGFDPWSGNQIPHVATKTWCNQISKYFLKIVIHFKYSSVCT